MECILAGASGSDSRSVMCACDEDSDVGTVSEPDSPEMLEEYKQLKSYLNFVTKEVGEVWSLYGTDRDRVEAMVSTPQSTTSEDGGKDSDTCQSCFSTCSERKKPEPQAVSNPGIAEADSSAQFKYNKNEPCVDHSEIRMDVPIQILRRKALQQHAATTDNEAVDNALHCQESGDVNNNNNNSETNFVEKTVTVNSKISCATQTSSSSYRAASLDRYPVHVPLRAKRLQRPLELNLNGKLKYQNCNSAVENWSGELEKFILQSDDCDMQIVINSLTPVLNRRRGSRRHQEAEKLRALEKNANMRSVEVQCSVGDIDESGCNMVADDSGIGATVPRDSRQWAPTALPYYASLLDAMHKRYCSEQYVHRNKTRSTEMLSPLEQEDAALSYIRKDIPQFKCRSLKADSCPNSARSSPRLPIARERSSVMQQEDASESIIAGETTIAKRIRAVLKSSQSDKCLDADKVHQVQGEVEANDACRWLRATGFPQYAQMYEDGEFPVDIKAVEADHDFLDRDSITSLQRRLQTLNKCARMKIESPRKMAPLEDSDEDDQCALSDKWKYLRSSRRWSRKDFELNGEAINCTKSAVTSCSSHDSLVSDQGIAGSPTLERAKTVHHIETIDQGSKQANSKTFVSPRLRRAASEKLKSARHLLKRMDSGKNRRNKKFSRDNIVEISGPVIVEDPHMEEKLRRLNCVDISPTVEGLPRIPPGVQSHNTTVDISFVTATSNDSGTETSMNNNTENSLYLSAHSNLSNSLNLSSLGRQLLSPPSPVHRNLSDTNLVEMYMLPPDYKPGSFPKVLSNGYIETSQGHGINFRTGSFSLGKDAYSPTSPEIPLPVQRRTASRSDSCPASSNNRASVYDNVFAETELAQVHDELDIILQELMENISGLDQAINELSQESEIEINDIDNKLQSNHINNNNVTSEEDPDLLSATTSSSHDSSDPDVPTEDLSHDDSLEQEHLSCRERRDSGVGSSLTRTPSDKKRARIRWHSFQKSHRPSFNSRNLQINGLSIGQLMVLRKLSLLKLTTLMEKYSPASRSGWNWGVPRFMKRHKTPDFKTLNVFGLPLLVILQRTGQPLPQCILYAMRYLRRTAADAVGIFRKSGVRSRIQKLRNDLEAEPDHIDFDENQAYDVADMLKQFFRELPECLLTNKLSETLISIFTYVPEELRLEAMQAATIMMPDECREVLQSLLLFLSDIAQLSDSHQMTANNLALCFAPSLFHVSNMRHSQSPSPKRLRKLPGIPDPKELQEQKAAQECLTYMIQQCKKLFMIPQSMLSKCRFSYIEQGDPGYLEDLNQAGDPDDYSRYVDNCVQGVLKESRDKFRGWTSLPGHNDIDLAYKKLGDGHPLRLWKCTVEVEAPPVEVLNRVLHERHTWDEDLLKWGVVEQLDHQTEVFHSVRNSMAPHPTRDYCELRSWRSDLPKGACVLVSTSIDHPKAEFLGGIRGVILASRYLIEPCGAGKSRLTHMSRIDTRGRSSEWYNNCQGHMLVNFMDKIRESFKHGSDGPETKV